MNSKGLSVPALAALTVCGGVHAADVSNVTVYGLVDTGVVRAWGGTARSTWSEDNYHTSRLGFRGVEDLGDGLTAIFKIETRFLPKRGTQQDSATFWNDEAYVGLANPTKYGTLRLGRINSPFYLAVAGRIDPFNGDGIGSMTGISSIGHNLSPGNPYDTAKGTYNRDVRINDAIDYASPVFGGFSLQLQTSLPGQGAKEKSVALRYDSPIVFAQTGWEKKTFSTDAYTAHVGGGVNWGPAKISLGYSWGYYDDDEALRGNKAKSLLLGVTYAATPFLNVLAAVGKLHMDEPTLLDAAKGTGSDAVKLAIGGDYYLSKRTKVYAHYAHVNQPISILFVSNTNKAMIGIDHKF